MAMLWRISVILIAMWVLRTLSSYTMNGFINIFLVVVTVILLLRLIGRPLDRLAHTRNRQSF